jgi:hypothetical protein
VRRRRRGWQLVNAYRHLPNSNMTRLRTGPATEVEG